MQHLRNVLAGAASLLGTLSPREYRIPQRGDFAADAKRLRSDSSRIALGLRRQIDAASQRQNGK